ncbi:putative ABC transport system permease protein [Streptococcus rupicaprae]|uniref:ABC transport system permease protein n=1 Tax=Streptococcus rupicaprae TaxID=759619 RepID=A0ABV2FH11_9STRE
MFFLKLALGNLKKAYQAYAPFVLSSVTLFVLLNTINLIWLSPDVQERRTTPTLLKFAFWVIAIFSAIIVTYSHRFLIKQRFKEFGLYNVLGMNRKRIATIASIELALVGFGVILFGIVLATVLAKFLYLILVNLLQIDGFHLAIQPSGYHLSVLLFAAIFISLIALTGWHIGRLSSLEMLSTSRKGEKEPKGNVFLGLFGVILIISAYVFAVKDASNFNEDYLKLIFLAVLAVIFGTYLFFVSFTTWFLKKQKQNKTYFYKRQHFIPVSQMLYRMKQNAFGLGNITILATMVMVTLIATSTIYFMVSASVDQQYPKDKNTVIRQIFIADKEKAEEGIEALLAKIDPQPDSWSSILHYDEYPSLTNTEVVDLATAEDYRVVNRVQLIIITAEEYKRLEGVDLDLDDQTVGYYHQTFSKDLKTQTIAIGEEVAYAVKPIRATSIRQNLYMGPTTYALIVVKDLAVLKEFVLTYAISKGYAPDPNAEQSLPLSYSTTVQLSDAQYQQLQKLTAQDRDYTYLLNNREESIQDNLSFTGTFIFIGFIIGMSFLLGACLIMYFKQISEGYEDKKAYKVLQEIGMSPKMVKKTISSQVWIIFFLPLIVSVSHVSFALFLMGRIIREMGILDHKILLQMTGITMFGFISLYFIIYRLTSRAYYKIIER